MKAKLLRVLFLVAVVYTMNSCSSDSSETPSSSSSTMKVMNYSYDSSELEAVNLINTYRVSVGLNAL